MISLLIEFFDEGEREEFFLEAENILEPIIPYSSRSIGIGKKFRGGKTKGFVSSRVRVRNN